MFPREVDVINTALVLPVFLSTVVKATSVWVLCVFGNSKSGRIGGWLDGGGCGVQAWCVCTNAHVCACTPALQGCAQPWWADVMLGSGLGSVLSIGSC